MLSRAFFAAVYRVLGLALPMAWSRFIQMSSWFIGVMMLARLGKTVLAASALFSAVQTTIVLFFVSFLFAVAIVSGRLHGEERNSELGALLQQGLVLATILSVIMILVFYYVDKLLILLGQPVTLVEIAAQYFHGFAFACLPIMLLVTIQQLFYGILKQRLVIYNNLLSLVFFIPVAYGLIYGKWGFPALGVKGLPYAMALQGAFNLLTLVSCLLLNKQFSVYRFFQRHNHRGFYFLKQLCHIGWPMSIQFGGELLAFSVLAIFGGWIGIAALSAMQITQQVLFLFLVPLFAVAEAAGIFVSQLIGAKQFDQVRYIGNICVSLGVVLVIVFSSIFLLFPVPLIAMYIDVNNPANIQTITLARWLFYLSAPILFMETLRNLYAGALRGFYDTYFPMWVSLFAVWVVAIPLSYVFAFWLNWGAVGVRLGALVGFLLGAVVLWQRWRGKTREKCVLA